MASRDREPPPATAGDFVAGLARAFAGALIFGLPMLLTSELWDLGATIDRRKLALLTLAAIPLLVGLAHRVGFESTFGWREDTRDACVALGIGLLTAVAVLAVFGRLGDPPRPDQLIGRATAQAVPAALGALLARSQLHGSGGGGNEDDEGSGGDGEDEDRERAFSGYFGTLFMMLVGALFLSLNMAPTQEIVLVSFSMTPWLGVALAVLTLGITHGFVRAHGNRSGRHDSSQLSDFVRYSLVGYGLALLISFFTLWIFGSIDGFGFRSMLMATVVLGFPSALGASAARMIL